MANGGTASKREQEVTGENDKISNMCVAGPSHVSQVVRIRKSVPEQIWPWKGCGKEQVDALEWCMVVGRGHVTVEITGTHFPLSPTIQTSLFLDDLGYHKGTVMVFEGFPLKAH